jgi:ribosome-associated protein
MSKIAITPHIAIDESELEESFVLSTGPGGQNVNKVASAVQLRFNAALSLSLPEPVRFRLMKLAGRRLTKGGVIVLTQRQSRDQNRNRAEARARLVELIRQAAVEPKPRRATKPPRAAKEKMLRQKKKHAELKRQRATPRGD